MNAGKKSVIAAAAVAAIGAVSLVAAPANAALELVIKNTNAVPGIAGAQWNTTNPFQTPSIDQSGNVGFRGVMLSGVGSVTTADNNTMWYGAPAGLNLVARTGNQAPGLPAGVNATAFNSQNLPMSPNGQLWFGSSTTAPNGYVATGPAGSLTKVARNGDTLPGGAGPLTFNPASGAYSNVNNAGHTIIGGSMAAGFGIWVGNGANLQKTYHSGQPFAGLPASNVGSFFGFAINGSGALLANVGMATAAGIDDNNNQVLATLPFGGVAATVIARENDPAPGAGGATYQRQFLAPPPLNFEGAAFTFNHGHFNNQGHAIYSAGLEGTGVDATNNAALFAYNGVSAQLFRRRGGTTSAVAGATYGFDSSVAFTSRMNNNDTVAWTTRLTTGVGGVTSADDTVLLRTSLGSANDSLVAREGSSAAPVPGALWGANFSDLLQNNADQIVFSSILLDDPNDPNNNVTTTNDQGLFAWDPNVGMSLIAREGDSLASIGIDMTVTAINLFNQANAEGGANALSDNGWLTFRVTGTPLAGSTDTSAIVRTQLVPEPAVIGLAALLLPLMGRRRRGAN